MCIRDRRDHEQIKALIKQKHEQGEIDIDDEEKKRLEVIAGQKWEDMWISKPCLLYTSIGVPTT